MGASSGGGRGHGGFSDKQIEHLRPAAEKYGFSVLPEKVGKVVGFTVPQGGGASTPISSNPSSKTTKLA